MNKLPSFQFYPGDWLKDPALRLCSPQARALWIDLLCLMWETENRGILRTNGIVWTEKDVEKTTGIDRKFLQELIQKGVCARAPRSGVLYSKRMVRDEIKRARLARNGQKGGKTPKQNGSKSEANTEANPKQTGKQNGGSSSSSSFSTSVVTQKDTDAYASASASADEPQGVDAPPPDPEYRRWCGAVVDAWNTLPSPPFARVTQITPKRLKALRVRYGEPAFRDGYPAIIDRIRAAPFLRGSGSRGWTADFDWLVKNSENYIRITEGKYDEQRGNGSAPRGTRTGHDAGHAEHTAAIERVFTGT